MREELTDHLRQALENAQAEARALNQDFVGTEHLLLGLMATPQSEAAAGLELAGVDCAGVRKRLIHTLPHGAEPPVITGKLPLSPKSTRAINGALVKAQTAGSSRVSSRLLLAALIDECETGVRAALRAAGTDLDQLTRVLEQGESIQPEA